MDRKIILISSALIAVLAVIASGTGLLWNDLYKNDTVSGAAQLVGNDLVTLVLSVPLLLVSAYFAANGSLRGRLVWMGTVFYFLYVYAMLSFMAAYNVYFLIYVALFSLSLYTFAVSVLTLDVKKVKDSLSPKMPVKAVAGFMFLVAIAITGMWLGAIVPSLMAGQAPEMLETYTTLVIQAMDLGIIVPLAAITGYMLLRKNAWGYALASLVLIKGVTLGTAVLSMAAFMSMNGVEVVIPQVVIFVLLVTCSAILAVMFYGNIKAGSKA